MDKTDENAIRQSTRTSLDDSQGSPSKGKSSSSPTMTVRVSIKRFNLQTTDRKLGLHWPSFILVTTEAGDAHTQEATKLRKQKGTELQRRLNAFSFEERDQRADEEKTDIWVNEARTVLKSIPDHRKESGDCVTVVNASTFDTLCSEHQGSAFITGWKPPKLKAKKSPRKGTTTAAGSSEPRSKSKTFLDSLFTNKKI